MSKARLFALVGAVFGLVGGASVIAGVVLTASAASFLSSAERTRGTVVELSGGSDRDHVWYPTIEYTVRGEQYSLTSATGTDPPAYRRGETVPIAFDPDDPHDARIADFLSSFLPATILGGAGIVITPIGAVLLLKARKTARQRAWLEREGREQWAQISEVDRDHTVRLRGRHPYVVHATWYDARTGRTHTATSDYFRHDPGPGLRGRTHVRVLYDPDDPDRNLLDLSAAR